MAVQLLKKLPGKSDKKNNKNNKDNKGCRGCKYLYADHRVFPPWECWYPRKSRRHPVRVDLERFRKGCKGRTVDVQNVIDITFISDSAVV